MVSLPNILKEVPPRVFCGFAHLSTQKASSAEQLQPASILFPESELTTWYCTKT